MIFRRISHRIALQFTAFVFLLLLVNGTVFLVVDLENGRRQAGRRLEGLAHSFVEEMESSPGTRSPMPPPPPMLQDRMRITDAQGKTIVAGNIFTVIPFLPVEGHQRVEVEEEQYDVFTLPVLENEQIMGYVQVAMPERFQRSELPMRIFLYLLISMVISGLVYFVGLNFARRSLKPAEEMMERLEQFTQDASHELRTPLAALSSSLDLALKTEKHREGILSAKEDLKKASQLVDRLLELARLDQFVIAEDAVDFSELVEASVDRHRSLAMEKHLKLESTIEPGVTVQGDAALLTQIIGNLLSNAIKFSPTGKSIRVSLAKNLLTVKDEGIGIPQEAQPHIFNRFYQAESSRSNGGFGLGLALVKRIVELHGWSIDFESTEGKGTTFRVKFG